MTIGISGPKGPGGPTGPVGADDVGGSDGPGATSGAERSQGAAAAQPLHALAAAVDSGQVSPEQALAQLVDQAGGDLDPAARAELGDLLADLMANDPYLAGLARDLGAAPLAGDPSGGDAG
jgi:hypothetical protein